MATAGIILVTNFSFAQAQTKNDFGISIEQKITSVTKVSGRLIFKETQKVIANADVFFITKSKFLKSTTNENGYF